MAAIYDLGPPPTLACEHCGLTPDEAVASCVMDVTEVSWRFDDRIRVVTVTCPRCGWVVVDPVVTDLIYPTEPAPDIEPDPDPDDNLCG